MFIAQIFIFLILVMIYIYTGLRMVESIKNEYLYLYFWIAYIFFGITLFNVLVISKYWGKLSTKIGPPGPRGPRGEDGVQGPDGLCNSDTNLIYAQKKIKETITDTILEYYNDIARDDLLDETNLKLKNNYLDYRVKLMITSKQFELVLQTPSDDNSPSKTPSSTKVYGKTIEDLTSYLCSIWREWIIGLINIDKVNARMLFIDNTAQIDISPKIENYFNTEIMKYDIWYWGATRVFRPLEAEICRSEFDLDGVKYMNSRYPIANRSKLQIIELEFTDKSIVNDDRFDLLCVLSVGNTEKFELYNKDFKKKYDVISKFPKTAFYIPKVYKVPKTNQKYYPIGCVAVNDKTPDNKPRKTIIVSGDIILPDSYEELTNNKLIVRDLQTDNIRYSRKRGAGKTRRYNKSFKSTTDYEVYLSSDLIKENEEYNISSSEKRLKLSTNLQQKIIFYKFNSKIKEYGFIGDIPLMYMENTNRPNKKYIDFNNKDEYMGIVGIPVDCLELVDNIDTIWSIRYDKLLNKKLVNNFNGKSIPKPKWIGRGSHSKGTKNFKIYNANLDRTVIYSNKIDIQNNKLNFNTVKVRTPEKEPDYYKIKEKCYKPEVYPIKEFDKKYEDLGFGWFGYPLKKYRKYSIFAYLGLMPEGIIVHRASGRKFYIKHYGGVEPNKFIIYLWNENDKDFKNAITVKNNTTCYIGIAKKTDPRCQFRAILDKQNNNIIRFEPVEYPGKYLKLLFDVNEEANLRKNINNIRDTSLKNVRPIGINLDHTDMYMSLTSVSGRLTSNNPVLFFNQPATGTNMQIVEEKMPRNIDRSLSSKEQYEQQQKLNRTNKNSFDYLYKDNVPIELLNELMPSSNLTYTY